MSAANKALVRRWINESYNKGNLKALDQIVGPTYVRHDPPTGNFGRGPEAERQVANLYRVAFPDLKVKIDEVMAERDLVAVRWTAKGTNTGTFKGLAPTGKKMSVPGASICRVSRGKIIAHWTTWDSLGMMQQLGLVEQSAAARA